MGGGHSCFDKPDRFEAALGGSDSLKTGGGASIKKSGTTKPITENNNCPARSSRHNESEE
jgi:hypothetical protein